MDEHLLNEIKFLKLYYDILKHKDQNEIGLRFIKKLKQFENEISQGALNIVDACLIIGDKLDNLDDLYLIIELISIGIEIKDEEKSKEVLKLLSNED